MHRRQGKTPARSSGAGFGSPSRPAAGFSTSTGSNLSYLAEPPDLSGITDANAVVSFRGLLKKDATTKAKALEDLVVFAQAHPHEKDGGVEDSALEAWVQLYPRTSIDNSRRVRELSHALQLELMKSARKRMEKRLPRVVGPWLAGTFDRDRIVARAASDGLSSFLTSEDKLVQFWRKCQTQILEYATDAVKETVDTLSDERSTSKDDADAKYHRVLGSSLSLVLGLLQRLAPDDLGKHQDACDEFFAVEAVWGSIGAADSYVRKTAYQLLTVCVDKRDASLQTQLPRLGRTLLADGLKSNQTGSALDYVRVLTTMTEKHPEIWGEKKPPFSRLVPLLQKGSQGTLVSGVASFWKSLDQLLAAVPQKPIPAEAASEVTKALRTGISGREEPRHGAVDAWMLYLSAVRRIAAVVSPADARAKFVDQNIYPLLEHYMRPPAERSPWSTGIHLPVLTRAVFTLAPSSSQESAESMEAEWSMLADGLVSRMTNSLPEVSKDFQKSQKDIADEGTRWFSLLESIHREAGRTENTPDASPPALLPAIKPSMRILHSAAELLEKRNYKPFGAASIIQSAFERTPFLVQEKAGSLVSSLFQDQTLGTLLRSPSFLYLLSIINTFGSWKQYRSEYKTLFRRVITALVDQEDNDAGRNISIAMLIANLSEPDLARGISSLQLYLVHTCKECAQGRAVAWELFEMAMSKRIMMESASQTLAKDIVAMLSEPNPNTQPLLRALGIIAHAEPALLSQDEALQLDLVTQLLGLMETTDSATREKAKTLRLLVEKRSDGQPPIISIIQENLDSTSQASLGIDTLVEQAGAVASTGSLPLEELFPSTHVWLQELRKSLQAGINPALSLTSTLGGAYLLVGDDTAATSVTPLKRDRNGYSIPARMALYTAKMLSSYPQFFTLPPAFQVELLYLLYLVVEISSDQTAILGHNGLWADVSRAGAASDVEDHLSFIRRSLSQAIADSHKRDGAAAGSRSLVDALVETMARQARGMTPLALYSTRALSDVLQAIVESRGFTSAEEQRFTQLDVMKVTPSTAMITVAALTGYGEALAGSKTVSHFCNRLVSEIPGIKSDGEKTMLTLALLNSCMAIYEVGELPVANNRLVFAVREITSWFEEPAEVGSRLATECCRALLRLLPCIKDVYGPYWERAIAFCLHLWQRAADDRPELRLPYIHASLKLVSALESLPEPNDDLEDAVKSLAGDVSSELVGLLKLSRVGNSQPEEIVDTLLCRKLRKIKLDPAADSGDLYGLVGSESRDVQTAAFDLLQRVLPERQEQLAVDLIIEKKAARLPDELLSLLLNAPTLDSYSDDDLALFPTAIRSYLLSWRLVFTTLSAAPLKIRNDYVDQLRSANTVGSLMDFIVDVLGHSAAHPLNLEKEGLTTENILSYDMELAESELEEKNMHWLLVHLYYLALKYIPGLFRTWYLECKSKQTRIALESWTTKHFSPIIVSEVLDDVQSWADSQDEPGDEETELFVKTNKISREVVASYEVDDMRGSISIRIPPSYPIDGVTVVGLNRVAVSEKKWQSWLVITQGVITFSNGSIIDGLSTFRRNVAGALKGHTECAICYSIISSDKKMPDKRCHTCKNLFHRLCLYKWFQTSSQNTCPLCRNPIDYLGSDTRSRNRFDD